MTDLRERYLHAIRRNLPAREADDITAELRDLLAMRAEDREAELGRALNQEEIAALLKEFGHPLVVAARYRPQQWLIGPDIFPFYEFVLRIALLSVGAIIVVFAIVTISTGGQDPWQATIQAIGDLMGWSLVNGAIVTLVFVVLERSGFVAAHLQRWMPDQLPDIGTKQPGPWESAIEVALSVAFLLWWTGVVATPNVSGSADFRIVAAPIWTEMYWPILVLASVRLVHHLVQWLRPRWKVVRGVLSGATAVAAIGLLAVIYQAGAWATVVPTGMPAESAAALEASLNLALRLGIVAIGVIWTLQCVGELWRLVRGQLDRDPMLSVRRAA